MTVIRHAPEALSCGSVDREALRNGEEVLASALVDFMMMISTTEFGLLVGGSGYVNNSVDDTYGATECVVRPITVTVSA